MTQTTPAISLELACLEDAQALVALRIAAMRASLERIGRFDPIRAAERFLASFSPAHTRHIIVNHQRVGFVVVKHEHEFNLLDHLYIRPESQGKGVGAAVLRLVIDEAKDQLRAVKVGALRDSPSNRFYIRHGFVLIERGEFDNYYLRPYENKSSSR